MASGTANPSQIIEMVRNLSNQTTHDLHLPTSAQTDLFGSTQHSVSSPDVSSTSSDHVRLTFPATPDPPRYSRRPSFGPLPDLRFEQSYLTSIAHAKSHWGVALITLRDQLFLPFLQGSLWSLTLLGWAHWNRTTKLSGSSLGAKARRWWYQTNNWDLPDKIRDFGGNAELAASVGDNRRSQHPRSN